MAKGISPRALISIKSIRVNICGIVTASFTQNGKLMIYVGIDIATLNHFASALSSDDEVMLQPFKFTNEYDGFHLLLQKLDSDSLLIDLESTAHYGNDLVEFLVNNH